MLTRQHEERIRSENVKRCVVALSGGADSVALLHSVVNLGLGKPVAAIHINHGLQDESRDWQSFCEKLCASLGVELTCVTVEVSKTGSLEEAARDARYGAFRLFLEPGDLLLLAHHSNDQVETIVLNLLRGSEAFGVRGMPLERDIGEAVLYRPMLDTRREEVLGYCKTHNLEWIEDPSNKDESLDRNHLRHTVLPGLAARFPSMESALLNAHARDAEVLHLMADYAEADLHLALSADGGIQINVVQEYTELRVVNLLRQFLSQKEVSFPSGRQLREFARVMRGSRENAMPSLKWSESELVRHRDRVYLLHSLPEIEQRNISLTGRDAVEFNGGVLTMELVEGEGIQAPVNLEMRCRLGGETIKMRQTRTLKNVLQEEDVPTWLRPRLPLIFENDELVAVPGISSWNIRGVYAENRKPGVGQSGWVFTFDINDRV